MSHPIDEYVGRRIRDERLRAGLSQGDLAERIGVAFQQLQKYERAANRVSASRLWMLAEALGQPIASFFPADLTPDLAPDLGAPRLIDFRLLGEIERLDGDQKEVILRLLHSMQNEKAERTESF